MRRMPNPKVGPRMPACLSTVSPPSGAKRRRGAAHFLVRCFFAALEGEEAPGRFEVGVRDAVPFLASASVAALECFLAAAPKPAGALCLPLPMTV